MFELARHLTERDREILVRLFDVQVLTTDQVQLLFFSSRRRCQDRLLFLYRHRLIDRFYPPSLFGSGKPQAHWLLDEAGAVLVAAIKRMERKQLGWQRRDDWASHPQLAHRLESNRFVTDLIAATLPDERMGVTAWHSSREAAQRLSESGYLRPDAGLILDVRAGPVECVLEWDRGTEARSVLREKLDSYRSLDTSLGGDRQPRSVLFVVPSFGRVKSLRRAFVELEPKREYRRRDRWHFERDPTWSLLAATADDLRERGPLGRVWQSITDEHEPLRALPELPARSDLGPTNLLWRWAGSGDTSSRGSGTASHRCADVSPTAARQPPLLKGMRTRAGCGATGRRRWSNGAAKLPSATGSGPQRMVSSGP